MQQIRNSKELRRAIARKQFEFALLLNGGAFSSKTISVLEDGRFEVENNIDGSVQELTGRQLYSESNIGLGMKRSSFVVLAE
jgi:hypothetical protein